MHKKSNEKIMELYIDDDFSKTTSSCPTTGAAVKATQSQLLSTRFALLPVLNIVFVNSALENANTFPHV